MQHRGRQFALHRPALHIPMGSTTKLNGIWVGFTSTTAVSSCQDAIVKSSTRTSVLVGLHGGVAAICECQGLDPMVLSQESKIADVGGRVMLIVGSLDQMSWNTAVESTV